MKKETKTNPPDIRRILTGLKRYFLLLPALVLLAAFPVAAQAGQQAEPELEKMQRKTAKDLRTVAICAQAWEIDHGALPFDGEGPLPVERLLPEFQPTYVRNLPLTDAWGNALVYEAKDGTLKVTSYGSDGRPDGVDVVEGEILLTEGSSQDLIHGLNGFRRIPAQVYSELVVTTPEEQTRKSLRVIGTALEVLAMVEGGYPVLGEGEVSASELRSLVEPMFVPNLPANDGWGQPIRYLSDGETYRLVSSGPRPRKGRVAARDGGTTRREIIYANGNFLAAGDR